MASCADRRLAPVPPRVTVLLPVRNGLPWLRAALESLDAQTFRDFELIVLEDGSTDRTAEWLDGWRRRRDADDRPSAAPSVCAPLRGDRLRIIATGGVGIACALNMGLAEARGAYIARQDADDESLPTRLARQVAFLDARPDIDVVATLAEYIDADDRVVDNAWVRTVRQQQDVALTPEAIRDLMPLTCCVTHGSILARTAALRAVGGYRPDLVPAEDYDLWLRLLPAHRFAKIDERLYRHRLHAAQSSTQARDRQTMQTLSAKLAHVRRVRPELPSPARLAIVGSTRGDALYRAAASDAGFLVADPILAADASRRPDTSDPPPTRDTRDTHDTHDTHDTRDTRDARDTPGLAARSDARDHPVLLADWDVLVVTDFAEIDRHSRMLRDRLVPVDRIGNFFVKRAGGTHAGGVAATTALGLATPLLASSPRRPLSIVHLTTFLQGGAGRAIVDLAVAQQRGGHDVLVVTSATGEDGYGNYRHHLDGLRTEGVPLLIADSLFKRDLRLNLHVLDRLREVRRPETVDIVHAHAATPARVGRLFADHAGRRVAVVQTQHGWGVSKTAEQAAHDLAVLRDVDVVVVTSEATGAWLAQQGVPRDRLTTIPCGLPAEAPAEVPEEARRLVEPLRAAGCRIIGCVGSVTANKNQTVLVRALARLAIRAGRIDRVGGIDRDADRNAARDVDRDAGRDADRNAGRNEDVDRAAPDVAAVFIGEGGESLIELANTLDVGGRVLAVGYHPDAERWMGLFDLLVVPSLTEGQGLVVLEAFRAGVPVIANDIPPLRELVTDDETGWLFDANDREALAATIEPALRVSPDHRAHVVDAARRRFLEHYTVDVMVAKHEALYQTLAPHRVGTSH